MDQIFGQLLVPQKVVKSFFDVARVDVRLRVKVDAKVQELHQDAFLDDRDVLRGEHVGPVKKYVVSEL